MFWDKVAGLYDLFEKIYNGDVYSGTGRVAAGYLSKTDRVLECACGTGEISRFLAPVCKELTVTDVSANMLKQAEKKLAANPNVQFRLADITALEDSDDSYDVVVAGNVIHLLPDPAAAMKELTRVCRNGGRLIIPTYINGSIGTNRLAVKALEVLGANFKQQFDAESYELFFEQLGYRDVQYRIVDGRMACDIAVIEVKK